MRETYKKSQGLNGIIAYIEKQDIQNVMNEENPPR